MRSGGSVSGHGVSVRLLVYKGEKMEADAVVVVLKLGLVSSSVTVWVECYGYGL